MKTKSSLTFKLAAVLAALVIFNTGCNLFRLVSRVGSSTFTPPSPIAQITPTATPSVTPDGKATEPVNSTAVDECQIVEVGAGAIAYERPSPQADEFGPVNLAESPIQVQARTADGWLGFEPHVAQAGNIGIFRLRWVHGSQVQVAGDCAAMPEVVGPPVGVCFTMPMRDIPVYAEPNSTSAVLTILTVGEYAAVIGKTDDGWAKLDLSLGNKGINQVGWITKETLNMNGPCDAYGGP